MVFEWFFKEEKHRKYIFAQFLEELKELKIIDEILENLIENKPVDEQEARREVNMVIRNLEALFQDFSHRLENQRETLRLYVVTSPEVRDYFSEIEQIAQELKKVFESLDSNSHRDDFWKFIETGSDVKIQIHKKISDLHQNMALFYEQAKLSLEWNYHGGAGNIGLLDFNKCVRKLGGVIDNIGATHFKVIYKLFEHVISPSQRTKGEIASGTFRGQIDRAFALQVISNTKKEAQIQAKGIRVENLRNYFKAYFLLKDEAFRSLFVTKYKDLFKV